MVGSRGRRSASVLAALCVLVGGVWAGAGPASAGTTAPPSAPPTDSPTTSPTGEATDTPTGDPTTTPTDTATGDPTASTTTDPTTTTSPTSPATTTPTTTAPSGPFSTTVAPHGVGPSTASHPAPPAEHPVDADGPLPPDEVQAQLAQAAALAAQQRAVDAGLQAAVEQLQQLGRQMSAAMDELSQARTAQAEAERTRQVNQALLDRLSSDLAVQRDALGRWARDTYAVGGPMGAYEGWLVALEADSTGEVAHNLAVLEEVGVAGSAAVERLQTAVSSQAELTRQLTLAAAQATAAQARANAVVVRLRTIQQQARLAAARLQVRQAQLVGKGRLSAVQRANLTAAEALVAAAGPVPAGAACTGAVGGTFANGMMPASALCPVWGAPNQLLRPDAAAAFRQLSRQFAAQFGRPICVTDSYRSLAGQVKVYAEKPALAARPGTSRHGLGVAVDLCGGIQSFGTAEHAWMIAHAPLTGWFHPPWAGPTGSKPEPWHWEFAG